MNTLLKIHYLFFSGDAAKLIGVHRSTVNRWLNKGSIEGRKLPNGQWLVTLDGINTGRMQYGMRRMNEEDAIKYWESGLVP